VDEWVVYEWAVDWESLAKRLIMYSLKWQTAEGSMCPGTNVCAEHLHPGHPTTPAAEGLAKGEQS